MVRQAKRTRRCTAATAAGGAHVRAGFAPPEPLAGWLRGGASAPLVLLRGRTNVDIATRLGISPRTVHKHVEHVFAKLGVGSRLEAVATVLAALGVGAGGEE